eukprot:TRINITY_DN10861_c0_g1_i3.p1 TRINITY_DN10861_c0_g1~~TRINITY_DN10861_c0_g1_i3.p1  ORF type:complete len:758 (-),score=144.18 TRINITY_DN10861_c0_g1_i3:210-2483(-)
MAVVRRAFGCLFVSILWCGRATAPSDDEVEIDFSSAVGGAEVTTLTANVISGYFLVVGEMDLTKMRLEDIDLVVERTLTRICQHKDVSPSLVMKRFLDISTLGQLKQGLNYSWQMLPTEGPDRLKNCLDRLAFMSYGPKEPPFEEAGFPEPALRGVFATELYRHPPTNKVVPANWALMVDHLSCSPKLVKSAFSVTTTPAPEDKICNGQTYGAKWEVVDDKGFDPTMVSDCSLAGSDPCVCSALPTCEWMPATGVCAATPNPGVSCDACSWQRKCFAPTQDETCSSFESPCDCAYAPFASGGFGCAWVGEECVARPAWNAPKTSCVDCSTQSSCSIPKVEKLFPPKASMIGEDSWILQVVFDRPMIFRWPTTSSGVELKCSSFGKPSPTFELAQSSLVLRDSMLLIDTSTFVNEQQQTCDVLIASNVLHGKEDLVPYDGMGPGEYTLIMPDTKAPNIERFEPANAAREVPLDTKVSIYFSEAVKLGVVPGSQRIEIKTVEEGQRPQERELHSIPMSSELVSLQGTKLTVDLAGKLNNSRRYTMFIPGFALRDKHGNNFTGLPSERYAFETLVTSTHVQHEDDSSGLFIGLSIAGAFLILAAVIAGGAFFKFQSIRARDKVSKMTDLRMYEAELEDLEALDEPVSPVSPVEALKKAAGGARPPMAPAPAFEKPATGERRPPSAASSKTSVQTWSQASQSRRPGPVQVSSVSLAGSARNSKSMTHTLQMSSLQASALRAAEQGSSRPQHPPQGRSGHGR